MNTKFAVIASASFLALAATPAMAEPFSGPYIGIEAGLDSYEVQAGDVFADGDHYDGLSGNGVVGALFAGYDLPVSPSTFVGIEAKAALSAAEITADTGTDAFSASAKETFGATARLGAMLNDNTGLYARAGWENTRFKLAADGVSESDRDDALVLGAGLETRFGDATSFRVEYTYADYSDFIKNNSVRAGVAYRF